MVKYESKHKKAVFNNEELNHPKYFQANLPGIRLQYIRLILGHNISTIHNICAKINENKTSTRH